MSAEWFCQLRFLLGWKVLSLCYYRSMDNFLCHGDDVFSILFGGSCVVSRLCSETVVFFVVSVGSGRDGGKAT